MKTTIDNLKILYEDNHLIAVFKRAGDISQKDKTGDPCLTDIIKEFIKIRDNKPGNVFLGLIHRIDRPTSGILVFAKTSKALDRMNKMFRDREIEKTYWAIVEKHPSPEQSSIQNWLKKNANQNKSYVTKEGDPNAKKAISHYTTLSKGDNFSLLDVKIETGRHHQIRTHLSSIGHPIRGDVKYGARRSNSDLSIDLLARSISFIHPVQKERITITSPIPDSNIWAELTKTLTT